MDLTVLYYRIADGDEVAFDELYHRTRSRMDTIVRRTLRCPHQSDEVVQEVFLEVWQRAGRFDSSRGSVLGWMSMLAHRRAVDRVRLVVTSAVRDERDAARAHVDQGDVWDEVVRRLDAQCVRAALATLSTLQREALSLTYLCGHSHRQAADLLAVPLSTFKTRVRDGMAVLRLNIRPA
ncbi:MAG: sigma-70 family RNA polymerase sigma factor [Propionibacteriaceae bacterium]